MRETDLPAFSRALTAAVESSEAFMSTTWASFTPEKEEVREAT